MRPLSLLEARVLGVLVEKSHTVPDSYPLSLNALDARLQPEDGARPGARGERRRGAGRGRRPEGALARVRIERLARHRATSTTWAACSACRRSRWRCSRC